MVSLFVFYLSFTLFDCISAGTALAREAKVATWADGKVSQDVEGLFSKVVQAVIQALEALQLNITKTTIGKDTAQIIGEYLDSRTIWIDLRRISQHSTHLEIRVSIKGNKEASYKIWQKIKSFL